MRTLFEAPAISVGELCRRIKGAIDAAFVDRVRVVGEISACKVSTLGHVYFALKDNYGLINCVCFRGTACTLDLRFPLADGVAVELSGRVTAYKERSQFQLVVDDIVPVGRGELFRKFELLKEKLQREGLFDEARKRAIPDFISTVAIVTSRGSAAFQDFLTTCRRRGAHVSVTLVHAAVQGDGAAPRIARAIRYAGSLPVDVVVVARGGGSIEDLWAFNTEAVARAIVRCLKPVITAIGHETDVTIADFAADRRAATPTAAAELVSPDRRKLLEQLGAYERRIGRALLRAAFDARRRFVRAARDLSDSAAAIAGSPAQLLDELEGRLRAIDPRRRAVDLRRRIAAAWQRLTVASARSFFTALESIRDLEERLRLGFAKAIIARRNALDVAEAKLFALGPSATLRRGYAIVFDARGTILTDSGRTHRGESVDIELRRGRVKASVTATEDRHDKNGDEEED
jgi:exodeoxyribonuclease VII large subunit